MTKEYAILLVSHSEKIAEGLKDLLMQVASDVTIKTAGGTEDGEIGTSFDKISNIIKTTEEEKILAFYDLGSAKMNIEMAMDFSEKEIILKNVSFIEGSYVAASLLQTDVEMNTINEQLESLKV
ncbi:MAG: PTS-dependent dihydroxyacetone kinase phosphotransferase subunit DhaM, partial [Atopostipes suicloacalis]|nr:PTS-dependent dihydroxyacetone kinase phosphotransferase subunit DhaM [Atopostipes suicloacalis]